MNDWNEVTIGSISTLRKGISYKSEEYCTEEFGNPFITIKCFIKGGGYEPSGLKYLDGVFTKADELVAGDILFSATDLTRAGDIVGSPLRVPNFGEDCIAIASTDCMKIEFNTNLCDKDFMYHRMMLSDIRLKMVAYSAGSTVLHLDTKQVLKFTVCIPKQIASQIKIARILDTIDRTITHTEALIEKYQQIKAGLMHDLFTRGIGADGKLRPPRDQAPEMYRESSIGWIPKEWMIKPIGQVFSIQLGKMLSPLAKMGKSECSYLNNRSVHWDNVDIENLSSMDFNIKEREKFKLIYGDLLVCEGGDVGRTAMWRDDLENCYFQKTIHRLRSLNGDVLPELMLRFMLYAKNTGMFSNFTSQTSIAHLTREKLLTVNVFVPSITEQEQLVKRFDSIDQNIATEISFLDKLEKQKSGLMNDLLTGKVQVNINSAEAVND